MYILLLVTLEPAAVSCVCSNLRMATRAVTRIYDEALEPIGVRTTHFSILARVDDDGPSSLGRLADRLAMDRTTLSRELEPLVRAGLVGVAPGQDRRQRIVSLTAQGVATLEGAYPRWRKAQRAMGDGLGLSRSRRLNEELRAVVSVARSSRPLDASDDRS